MESSLRWIFSKMSNIKAVVLPARSSSKEKAPKSPGKVPAPEKKLKRIRILEARSRAPLF